MAETLTMPKGRRFRDLTGERYGRLEVVQYLGRRKGGGSLWLCRCDCGNEIHARPGDLNNGNTRSCGCLRSDVTASRNTTHGLSRTPEYRTWSHLLDRCNNPNGT